ncbi:glucose 1-dehydrogenase [Actinomycetospora endophytica]|uniref:Glucose 1-dehydrogenase n=1 Tax=Actinomycetospora endophytica TaxID=2291215 RepID=A0ABS8PAQ1_9PSEU|nr:glucose 1-dehydrogenase [Actinomycetospora endophytica]MCD2195340.1 glucose 1-dehydrogenase [Actinomycetospora endophytica]
MSPDPLFDLTDRVVVITGASSGIGASAARCYAERGARVVLAARRKERLDELAAELPGSLPVPCDVGDPAACQDLVDRTLAEHGRIDVLVNNAGTHHIGPAEDESVETFRGVVDVNLNAVFALTRAAARPMLDAGRGSVITVASMFGLVGSGQVPQASYAASKGAVVNLTRELGAQWARRGVRVNAIAPAFFSTEMTTGMFSDEGAERWMRRQTPMGRAGELAELHGALVYLAADASSYVTGTTLSVDGGWTAV